MEHTLSLTYEYVLFLVNLNAHEYVPFLVNLNARRSVLLAGQFTRCDFTILVIVVHLRCSDAMYFRVPRLYLSSCGPSLSHSRLGSNACTVDPFAEHFKTWSQVSSADHNTIYIQKVTHEQTWCHVRIPDKLLRQRFCSMNVHTLHESSLLLNIDYENQVASWFSRRTVHRHR